MSSLEKNKELILAIRHGFEDIKQGVIDANKGLPTLKSEHRALEYKIGKVAYALKESRSTTCSLRLEKEILEARVKNNETEQEKAKVALIAAKQEAASHNDLQNKMRQEISDILTQLEDRLAPTAEQFRAAPQLFSEQQARIQIEEIGMRISQLEEEIRILDSKLTKLRAKFDEPTTSLGHVYTRKQLADIVGISFLEACISAGLGEEANLQMKKAEIEKIAIHNSMFRAIR